MLMLYKTINHENNELLLNFKTESINKILLFSNTFSLKKLQENTYCKKTKKILKFIISLSPYLRG